jgi:hypothetical protein
MFDLFYFFHLSRRGGRFGDTVLSEFFSLFAFTGLERRQEDGSFYTVQTPTGLATLFDSIKYWDPLLSAHLARQNGIHVVGKEMKTFEN